MYASLVHLSLSDATMLTFVAPILTGLSGAIILKETVSLWETFAGCRHPRSYLPWVVIHRMFSLQFLWRNFDCQAAVSFRWFRGRFI